MITTLELFVWSMTDLWPSKYKGYSQGLPDDGQHESLDRSGAEYLDGVSALLVGLQYTLHYEYRVLHELCVDFC